MKLLIIIFNVAASTAAKLTGYGGTDGSIYSGVIELVNQNPRALSGEISLDQELLVLGEKDGLIKSPASDQADQASPDSNIDHSDEIGYENFSGIKQTQSKELGPVPLPTDDLQAFGETAAGIQVTSSGKGLTLSSESDRVSLVTNSDLTFVESLTTTEAFPNSSEIDQTFSIYYANYPFPGDSTGHEENSTDVEITPSVFPEILTSDEDLTTDLDLIKTHEFGQTSFASTNHSIAETKSVTREDLSGPDPQSPISSPRASFPLRSNQSSEPEFTEKESQPEAETEPFNINFEGSTDAEEILDECPEDQVRHTNGKCVTPEVTRNVFVISAPKLLTKFANLKDEIPQPKVEHNIIFIHTAGNDNGREPIIVPPPQRKNVIYVLNKESEVPGQRVIEVPTHPPVKPEVYYVNYGDGDEPFLLHGINFETALISGTEGEGVILDNLQHSSSNLLVSNERTVLADYGNVTELIDDKNDGKTSGTTIALGSGFPAKGNFVNKTEMGSIQDNKESEVSAATPSTSQDFDVFEQATSLLFETPAENEVPF